MNRHNLRRALRRLNRDSGQGMTEYIIIVAIVAIAAIGVVTVFGENIRHIFGASADALAGNTQVVSGAKADGKTKAAKKKNLKTFGQQ